MSVFSLIRDPRQRTDSARVRSRSSACSAVACDSSLGLLEHDLRVVARLLGLLQLVVDLVDVVLDRGQPAAQLVGLALQLEPARVQRLDEASTSASSCSAAATCPMASSSASSAAASFAPSSGTTCSPTGSPSSSSPSRPAVDRDGLHVEGIGSATTDATSSSETPVEVNAVTHPAGAHRLGRHRVEHRRVQHPLDLVDDRAGQPDAGLPGQRASRGRQRGGQLAPLPGQRSQLVAVERLRRRAQRLGQLQHRVDLVALAANQQVHRPGRDRGLLQLLDLRRQRLVAASSRRGVARLGEAVRRARRTAGRRSAVSSSTRRPPGAAAPAPRHRRRSGSRDGHPRARAGRTGRRCGPAMPTYTVPTGCPSCRPDRRHPWWRAPSPRPAARGPRGHLRRAVRGDDLLGGHPEQVALDLGRVADHRRR